MAKQDKPKQDNSRRCAHNYARVEIVDGRARNRCSDCGALLP